MYAPWNVGFTRVAPQMNSIKIMVDTALLCFFPAIPANMAGKKHMLCIYKSSCVTCLCMWC